MAYAPGKQKWFQFVSWFPFWKGFALIRLNDVPLGTIYAWSVFIGFWEIRKWKIT